MNRALVKLYKLRLRGAIRMLLRSAKTARGAAALIFAAVMLAMMTVPGIVIRISGASSNPLIDPRLAYDLFSIGLFFFTVLSITTTAGERVIHFAPSEIDLLFPAPLTRRELLIYKIAGSWSALLFLAIILSISLTMFLGSWLAAFVGILLALMFIHALTICVQMIGLIIGEYAYKRTRRVFAAVVLLLVAYASVQVATHAMSGSWSEVLHRFREAPAAKILLAPARLFANIVFSSRIYPELLGWSGLGIALNGLMYSLAMMLDANYLEAAVQVSRRVQESFERAKRSGGLVLSHGKSSRRTWMARVPRFPRWGGLGPLARRQTLLSINSLQGVLFLFLIILLGAGVPMLIGMRGAKNFATVAPMMAIGALAYVTFLLSSQIALSFRGDLDHMPLFKSLPVPVWTIVVGETIPAAALLGIFQCSVFAIFAIILPDSWQIFAAACAFAVPYNLLMFGMDGVLFLLYPVRFTQGVSGLVNLGRHFTSLVVKMIMLACSTGFIALPGGLLYLVTNQSVLSLTASWVASWIPCAVLMYAMAWAFERFEVSDLVSD